MTKVQIQSTKFRETPTYIAVYAAIISSQAKNWDVGEDFIDIVHIADATYFNLLKTPTKVKLEFDCPEEKRECETQCIEIVQKEDSVL